MSSVDKQKAIDKLIQECGCEPDARISVYGLTSLFSARVFEYVEEKSRGEPVEPPSSGGQDEKVDEQKGSVESPCRMEDGWFGDDAYNEAPGFQTVYVGGLSKKDMQILFTLMCLVSKKPKPKENKIDKVQGVGAVIPKTETNQVCMPAETCVALARFLYGRGARESTDLFIRDLRRMSRREFSMMVPTDGWHATEYNTIPLSIMVTNDVHLGVGGGKRTFASITITLSDIFFYESRLKYGMFNIKAMFKGLKGKNSDLFARLTSYASRFLPTVAMQRKKGRGYKTSVPIEEICPGYNTSARQNKSRTRKSIRSTGKDASPLLMSVSITLSGDIINLGWE